MKKCTLQDISTASIGVVEQKKMRDDGAVKYRVAYRDYKGREYSAWTNWIRDDGYDVGDSIPVSNISIPSFGLLNLPVSVNNHPQHYIEPYVFAMVAAGIGALIVGYNVGKSKK